MQCDVHQLTSYYLLLFHRFRVNGPQIHRKMGLAQYPPGPIGSPDDPLADPFDDPSYSFSYSTPDQSRSEDNDATGRVRGKTSP